MKIIKHKKTVGSILILLMISLALFGCERIVKNENDETKNQPEHTHEYVVKNDENQHHSVCECGAKTESESHDYEWVIDKEPSYTIVGIQHKECKICGHKTEQNTAVTQTHNEDGTLKLDENLVSVLREHFSDIRAMQSIKGFTLGGEIKRSTYLEPMLVKFSRENYYYVVAYFNDSHEYREEEIYVACCRDKYTFVGFENLEDIPETYNGEKIIGAFQINLQEFCYNIKTGEAETVMEHYAIFYPEFVDGVCVAPDIEFYDLFIKNIEAETDRFYYSCDIDVLYQSGTIDCIEIDGEYYVYEPVIHEEEDGSYSERTLEIYFEDYYDQLKAVMISGKYSETVEHPDGTTKTYNYAVFKLEDIAELMRSIDVE